MSKGLDFMKRPILDSEIKDLNKEGNTLLEDAEEEEADFDDERGQLDSSRRLLSEEEDPATERVSDCSDLPPQDIVGYGSSIRIGRLL